MQLRHYFSILRRFWLLIVALPLVVGLVSLALALVQPPTYSSQASLMVTQTPRIPAGTAEFPDFNLNHSWLGSEFILDDLPQVVTSRAFAEDVSELLAAQGYEVAPEQVQHGMEAEVLHRLVTIDVTAVQPQQAEAMARGAVEALQVNGLHYWDRASGEDNGLSIAVLNPATPAASLQGTSQLVLEVGLRVALALAAAVGIAFLWYYLDDTVRDQRQAETWIGMPVVGVIPKE